MLFVKLVDTLMQSLSLKKLKKKRLRRGEKTYLLYLECLRKTGRDEDAQRLATGLRSWDDVEEEPPFRGYYRPLPDELVDKLETLYSLERTILWRYHLDNEYPIYSIEDMSKIVGKSPTFCQHLEEEALKRIGLTQEYFVALKSELDQRYATASQESAS